MKNTTCTILDHPSGTESHHVSSSPGKILVVGPAWVGDMVMAQSLVMLLRQRNPAVLVDMLAPDWSRPLIARMPEIRRAWPVSLAHGRLGLGVRHRLALTLRGEQYDRAIVLPNSFKSAMIPFWARVPRRTGYLGEMRWGLLNDVRRLDKRRLPMTVQRFLALGVTAQDTIPTEIPTPHLVSPPDGVDRALRRLGLQPPRQPLLALCPGAEYGPAKRWPIDYFAQVARTMEGHGWSVWIFGSAKDAPSAREICDRRARWCVNLAGRTRLEEAIDLLSLADAVVSNDSGLMHVAAALGRPLVALFGSSDPTHTPPLGEPVDILSLNLPCSPCFRRECPLGHLRCLRDLTPKRVIDLLRRGLPETAGDAR